MVQLSGAGQLSTEDLDGYLMFGGWEKPNLAYDTAISEGWFPRWESGMLSWETMITLHPEITREEFYQMDELFRATAADFLSSHSLSDPEERARKELNAAVEEFKAAMNEFLVTLVSGLTQIKEEEHDNEARQSETKG